MDDLAAYIADHYGQCDLGGQCDCLKPPDKQRPDRSWKGRGCIHWTPVKATNWEELQQEFKFA